MCGTCGCGFADENADKTAGHQHETEGRRIAVELDLLARNNALAEKNRQFFDARNIFALNLLSSPGAGKTSLLLAEKGVISLDSVPSILWSARLSCLSLEEYILISFWPRSQTGVWERV